MNLTDEREELSLISLLQETAVFLWKGWPKDMQLANIGDNGNKFTLRGTCPHCKHKASFNTITSIFEQIVDGHSEKMVAGARCNGCNDFILAVLEYRYATATHNSGWFYSTHYPIGKADDSASEHIPDGPRRDFQEALRCRSVNALNATVEMCRRALEASCLDQGASYSSDLEKMVDSLESKRIITPTLKDVAHKIRLGGNRGAHPVKDGENIVQPAPVYMIEKEHADAILAFTRHFLDHVYVIPNQLPQFDFSKPKVLKS